MKIINDLAVDTEKITKNTNKNERKIKKSREHVTRFEDDSRNSSSKDLTEEAVHLVTDSLQTSGQPNFSNNSTRPLAEF